MPCFGAHAGISSWAWWFHVFTDAYIKTINEFNMDEDVSYDDGGLDGAVGRVLLRAGSERTEKTMSIGTRKNRTWG